MELEAAVRNWPGSQRTSLIYLGFDRQYRAGGALARTLWLQGYPVQAEERARQAVKDAARHRPSGLAVCVLLWAASVFLWTGNLESAEEHLDRFVSHAESHSLGPYIASDAASEGNWPFAGAMPESGVESLQRCLEELHAARYEVLATACNISLAQGLAAIGRCAEGITVINETIQQVETNGDAAYLPELLRVKGTGASRKAAAMG